ILLSQVPGGMLTNMESQLKEQNAIDKMDEVLLEIPRVREDLGFIPLVTPTSQIVGTQAVLNILTGERYKTITKESMGILKGEYGASPAPVNAELQAKVLDGAQPITCRPADNIEPELDILETQFDEIVAEKGIELAADKIDDLLTYALFPQVGIQFLANRNNPDFFEPAPQAPSAASASTKEDGVYTVSFKGNSYVVEVSAGGDITSMQSASAQTAPGATVVAAPAAAPVGDAEDVNAPLSGTIWKVLVSPNQQINEGDTLVILEAMKMETEIKAARSGTVVNVSVKEGDSVTVGQALLSLA
ncbi:MAG TPA: biotin/lipoyl-binding protein, partial [Candidatus Thioglobus sp.]|nr:biotin/lipoyl-binding protein [Candidatus Thioglobus sp.]